MSNIILITTSDKIILDEKIKELTKNSNDIEVVHYDLSETPIEQLVEDLDTYNFLTSKKIIVGHNANFLSSDKSKIVVEHNIERFEKYLENPSCDNILVLTCDNIDKRKKITLALLKKADLVERKANIHNIIKNKLENYSITSDAEKKLLEYCQDDYERISNELDKLMLYKMNEKTINAEDVENIVMKSLDDNIFHLADSILSRNKKEAFELYNNFILHGEQVVNIIRILSNKIRLIYQVKVLLNDGNSDQSISKLLKVHEYPVKLAREASYRYSEKILLTDLEKLANLDLEIKSGKSDGEVEFELLLATI